LRNACRRNERNSVFDIKKGNEIEKRKEERLDDDCRVRRKKYIKCKRRREINRKSLNTFKCFGDFTTMGLPII
jgi:hypothetical protein